MNIAIKVMNISTNTKSILFCNLYRPLLPLFPSTTDLVSVFIDHIAFFLEFYIDEILQHIFNFV